MKTKSYFCLLLSTILMMYPSFFTFLSAKPSEINYLDVTNKMQEIMKAHVTYKKLNPLLARRSLENFIEAFDPMRIYFLENEVERWLEPEDHELEAIVNDFEYNKFPAFESIFSQVKKAVVRRQALEQTIDQEPLPMHVSSKEFHDPNWCKTEKELLERLKRLRALQLEMASKMGKDAQTVALQRLKKRQQKVMDEFCRDDAVYNEQLLCTYILKAMASSLDAHTNYFTPSEANQFLIAVQQKLLGIGVQLRDDVDGFSIVKIVEGGPAENSKELKVKDKIIAINGEPIIGFEVTDVVDLIRGQEGTDVVLRIIREIGDGDQKSQELRDIHIPRGEVVLKESRLDTSIHPFGNGVIAYLHLYSFYQDEDSSSAEDITKALNEIKSKNSNIIGTVLDLRSNAGGILSQAVAVTGLFIDKGIVVSIKDENGVIHNLRDFDSQKIFSGPMIVLISRTSASAAEIVAQTLQDYGRVIVIGDDHSFGKGSFQTFTLVTTSSDNIDPKGEYKVTRGCYYTASGKSPQLVGVQSDIEVPSGFSFMEIGEKFAKYPLESDHIDPGFNDNLADIPLFHREKLRRLYSKEAQKIETKYRNCLQQIKQNSLIRQKENKAYQHYLDGIQRSRDDIEDGEQYEKQSDFQLVEAMNIIKDLILLERLDQKQESIQEEKAA